MNAAALDTMRVAKRLRDAGFSEAQAESVTDAIREGVTGGDVATKEDIRTLKEDIRALRAELTTAVATLETKIIQAQAESLKWMFGMMLAQGALVVTLIRLLPGK